IGLAPRLLQSPSLRVTDNGVELARSDLEKPIHVDGGVHTIAVAVLGHEPWSTQVSIGSEGDHRVLAVPDLGDQVTPPRAKATPVQTPVLRPQPTPYWTTRRVLGWSAVGAGAACGALSAYFTVATKAAQTDVEKQLTADQNQTSPTGTLIPWDASGHSREVDGKRDAALAQGFGIASGALLVGGAALILFGSEAHEHAPANLSLAISPVRAQLGYSGSF
ncbi:MAG TPA: hypothetical protein VIM73_16400, partial [Polyangiaceae bacterium]